MQAHAALRVIAAAPSRVAVGAALECNERSGDVPAGCVAGGEGLVVLVEGADFEHLGGGEGGGGGGWREGGRGG
jgi:hypothetical protein